jgi:hypothetical protein
MDDQHPTIDKRSCSAQSVDTTPPDPDEDREAFASARDLLLLPRSPSASIPYGHPAVEGGGGDHKVWRLCVKNR